MEEHNLDVPPFPPLRWDRHFWVGEIALGSWAGFQARYGPYASVSSEAESDGRACLTVTVEAESPTPLPEQILAFQFLLDNEKGVAESVLKAIFAEYPRLREIYVEEKEDEANYLEDEDDENEANYLEDEDEENEDVAREVMPAIEQAEQLRSLIGLSNVHILKVVSDGLAYIGFEFGCTWDDEHGLGVMVHRDRVIEVGGADTSFLWWIADRDARSS